MIVDYVRVFEPVGSNQNQDSDGDGISDEDEAINGTDPNQADTDGDGLTDGEEDQLGTNPLNSDTDYDSLPDGEEVSLGTDPLSDDSDGDEVTDDVEIEIDTDPLDADSDDDGLPDGKEVSSGTDPLDADSDADGFTDGDEVSAGTNPLDPASNADQLARGRLETPAAGSPISGKGLISGWHCTAQTIEVSLNSGARIPAATRTEREDTVETCGDSDNGFALLVNMGNLPSGQHLVRAYADGYLFAEHSFSSIQLSAGSFIRDRSSEVVVRDFPTAGREVVLRWEQSLQNFVIVEERVSP